MMEPKPRNDDDDKLIRRSVESMPSEVEDSDLEGPGMDLLSNDQKLAADEDVGALQRPETD